MTDPNPLSGLDALSRTISAEIDVRVRKVLAEALVMASKALLHGSSASEAGPTQERRAPRKGRRGGRPGGPDLGAAISKILTDEPMQTAQVAKLAGVGSEASIRTALSRGAKRGKWKKVRRSGKVCWLVAEAPEGGKATGAA